MILSDDIVHWGLSVIEVKLESSVCLIIPDKYRTMLAKLKKVRKHRDADKVYWYFRTLMEKLMDELSDQAHRYYGTQAAALKNIGLDGNRISATISDCPFDCFWSDIIVDKLSDEYGFGGLLERWQDDP